MADILKLFSKATLLNYMKERQYKQYLGSILFPEHKIEGLEMEYIKGANNVPVIASVHGFDTETEIASRDTADKVSLELALIKRKIKISEKEIIILNSPRNNNELQMAVNHIYNDHDNMVEAVRAKVEVIRMAALANGIVEFNENKINLNLDYGVPANHKETLTGEDRWSDPSSTPLQDIYDMVDRIVSDEGEQLTRALTSKTVLSDLVRNESIRKAIHGVNSDRIVTKKQLNELLSSMELPTIETYDERYRKQNANGSYTTERYFPVDKFVLLPEGPLGETCYGLTAEEIELRNQSDVEIKKVGNIITEVYKTNDPVAHWTKAVATALPSFPTANKVYQAKVR